MPTVDTFTPRRPAWPKPASAAPGAVHLIADKRVSLGPKTHGVEPPAGAVLSKASGVSAQSVSVKKLEKTASRRVSQCRGGAVPSAHGHGAVRPAPARGLPVVPKHGPAGEPAPAPAASGMAQAASAGKLREFDRIFARMPQKNHWNFSLQFFATSISQHFPARPTSFRDARMGVWNWGSAHIWHGLLSRGRGEHFHAVRDAVAERDFYRQDLLRSDGTVANLEVQPYVLWSAVDSIHDDTLRTLRSIDGALFGNERRDNPATVALREFAERHKRLYGVATGPADDKAVQVTQAVESLLKKCEDREAKRGRLGNAYQRSIGWMYQSSWLDRAGVSALLAQLTADQAIGSQIAEIKTGGMELIQQATTLEQIMETRSKSKIQLLRKAGFRSLREADHAIRSYDYMMHGLATPKHKLNLILSRALRKKGSNGSDLADLVAGMADGEEVKLKSGWFWGAMLPWLLIAIPPSALFLAYFGFTPTVGFESPFGYSASIKKTGKGVKISFERSASRVAYASLGAWAGVAIKAITGSYAELGAGMKLRGEIGGEASFSILIPTDHADGKDTLRRLFSGEAEDPYEMLAQTDGAGTNYKAVSKGSLNLSAGVETGLIKLAERNHTDLQWFGYMLNLGGHMSLFDVKHEHGHSYDADKDAYDQFKYRDESSILTHRPAVTVTGFLGSQIRARGHSPIDMPGAESAKHGPYATGRAALGFEYEILSRKSWGAVFGFRPKPGYKGFVATESGDAGRADAGSGDLRGRKWDLTVLRNRTALDSPTIAAILKKMPTQQERDNFHANLVDAISFTNRNNREAIARELGTLMCDHSHLMGIIRDLDDLASFSRFSDCKKFRRKLKRLAKQIGSSRSIDTLFALTDPKNTLSWPARLSTDQITISMEAGQDDKNALGAKPLTQKEFAALARNVEIGRATGFSVTDTRATTTYLSWPLFLTFGSDASLTMVKKTEYKCAAVGAAAMQPGPQRTAGPAAAPAPVRTNAVAPTAASPQVQVPAPTPTQAQLSAAPVQHAEPDHVQAGQRPLHDQALPPVRRKNWFVAAITAFVEGLTESAKAFVKWLRALRGGAVSRGASRR